VFSTIGKTYSIKNNQRMEEKPLCWIGGSTIVDKLEELYDLDEIIHQ
jgi:hypothetical protein